MATVTTWGYGSEINQQLQLLLVAMSSLLCCVAGHAQGGNIVFVINSGENPAQVAAGRRLAANITSQLQLLQQEGVVHVASEDWPDTAGWTYFPLLDKLNSRHAGNSSWVVFVEEETQLDVRILLATLKSYLPEQSVLLCRGVWDREETIIHHFDLVDKKRPFLYPDTRAGMVLSTTLLKRLAQRWMSPSRGPRTDFTIDAKYEFGHFVKEVGTEVTSHPAFCMTPQPNCAITYTPQGDCGRKLSASHIHVAVKTCRQFHATRLPVVKKTWWPDAPNSAFYSDLEESAWGTISLGVANTDMGHCAKTLSIIRHVAHHHINVKWLAIVDDDTLISISQLRSLLACHNANELVAVGERYGYRASTHNGYSYITGGGGMVLSLPLVKVLSKAGVCECPTPDTPDDMYLGMCLQRLNVPITHSHRFHQARPNDYPPELLGPEPPISFHKHWMVDPLAVYSQWLDGTTGSQHPPSLDTHTEL